MKFYYSEAKTTELHHSHFLYYLGETTLKDTSYAKGNKKTIKSATSGHSGL